MRIYRSPEEFTRLPFAVVTSGTFDGVHKGHQEILRRLTEIARRHNGESVVLTFWPHPRLILQPEKANLRLLNTFSEKARLLEQAGVDHLLVIPFNKEFASVSSESFIRDILVDGIGTKRLVIGYDHHFGRNREGNFQELKQNGPAYGFEVEEIPRLDIDQAAVSSTAIRNFLSTGEVLNAAALLGRPYSLTGEVVHGDHLGRQLGFPTANLDLIKAEGDDSARYKLVPADGIYAVIAEIENRPLPGMLYIGNRPTVGGKNTVMEVNVLEFNGDLYGKKLTVHLMDRIRGDIHFSNMEELRLQLERDREATWKVLDNIENEAKSIRP